MLHLPSSINAVAEYTIGDTIGYILAIPEGYQVQLTSDGQPRILVKSPVYDPFTSFWNRPSQVVGIHIEPTKADSQTR
jgi:hypothetical protein